MNILVYDDDKRYDYVAKYLGVENNVTRDENEISKVDVVLLPFKDVLSKISVDSEYINKLKKDVRVFGCVGDTELQKIFSENKIYYREIMNDKTVAIMNAIPTAEAVIHNIIQNRNKTIFDSEFLVVGYGVCGREIAQKIKAMGGRVTIIEKDKDKKQYALTRGIKNIDEENMYKYDYDCIVNTVPEKIISRASLKNINEYTYIIDISSKPYGFSDYDVESKNINILGSLPSKFAVETAGKYISDYIKSHI